MSVNVPTRVSRAEGKVLRRKILAVLVGLLVVAAAVVVFRPNLTMTRMPKARRMEARAHIRNFSNAAEIFKIDTGQYPKWLPDLTQQGSDVEGWNGPYLQGQTIPADPRGRPYFYVLDSLGYRIISYGADGVEGGAGEDADIIHDSRHDSRAAGR